MVYRQGKVAGRFEMQLDELRKALAWRKEVIDTALLLAERHDWLRRDRLRIALRAAGIYVAKGILGLPR
jgi:hypothetical protein